MPIDPVHKLLSQRGDIPPAGITEDAVAVDGIDLEGALEFALEGAVVQAEEIPVRNQVDEFLFKRRLLRRCPEAESP